MFQFGFSVASEHENWYRAIEDVFTIKVKKHGGLIADVKKHDRIFVSVACESVGKAPLMRDLRNCLIDMYATVVKEEYLRQSIRLPIERNSYNLLLHTLVAFDRENEREIIESKLPIGDGIALEGVFHFRLQELRKRWEEIAELAKANAPYLIDEDTLNELIRFLISAVSPKIMRLEISQHDDNYNVCGHMAESKFEYDIAGTEQLLLYFIDIAPLELKLNGQFTDKRLCERLVHIFDVKRGENCEVGKHR